MEENTVKANPRIPTDSAAHTRSDGPSARKPWLDGLRALAMLLVIIGHMCPGETPYFVFTSPVKIPLFFAITGYLTGDAKKTPSRFFTDLFWHLVVPWFLGSVLGVLIRSPLRGFDQLPVAFIRIFTEVSLWFLPCCIFAEILWYCSHRFIGSVRLACAASVALFAVGIGMMKLDICNAMMINRAFIAQFYLLIGFVYRRLEDRLARLSAPAVLGLLALYVGMGFLSLKLWPGQSLDVHVNRYYNIPYCMLMIFVGCFSLFLAAERLPGIPRALQFIGRNTLIYYITHIYAVSGVRFLFKTLRFQPPTWIAICVALPIVCLICAAFSMLANRWLPLLAGKYHPARR